LQRLEEAQPPHRMLAVVAAVVGGHVAPDDDLRGIAGILVQQAAAAARDELLRPRDARGGAVQLCRIVFLGPRLVTDLVRAPTTNRAADFRLLPDLVRGRRSHSSVFPDAALSTAGTPVASVSRHVKNQGLTDYSP